MKVFVEEKPEYGKPQNNSKKRKKDHYNNHSKYQNDQVGLEPNKFSKPTAATTTPIAEPQLLCKNDDPLGFPRLQTQITDSNANINVATIGNWGRKNFAEAEVKN
jgi:hypothetical protein